MTSDTVRDLLAAAQAAELKGEKGEAARLLRQAAEMYRDANNPLRAMKMLRHARRLEGHAPEPRTDAGGGVSEEEEEASVEGQIAWIERTAFLSLGEPEAWCSFCCRPRREVGPLVQGPTDAYICRGCVEVASGLLAPDRRSDA